MDEKLIDDICVESCRAIDKIIKEKLGSKYLVYTEDFECNNRGEGLISFHIIKAK